MNGFVHISLGYGLFAGLHSKPSIWSECSVKKKKKKKKASFKKFLIQLKYNSMCLARYVWMFGESSFIKSIFRVIPYKLT